MNTVSKLIYLKNDIVTYMNFIYMTIYHFQVYQLHFLISQCVGGLKKPCQGDIIVINWLITIISPCPETFKITDLQLLITKFLHANTFRDKRSSTSEQALWEINKLYPIHSYDHVSLLLTLDLG